MNSLEARYLGGTPESVTRADMADAFRAGPSAAAARRGAGPPLPASDTLVDVEAMLREARAAGGDAFVFEGDEEDGVML
jgi:hypothetical protein